jgi:glutamine cyclotransferase
VGYRVRLFVVLLVTAVFAPSVVTAQEASPVAAIPSTFGYRVVTEYPHDRRAFTQGLAYVDGVMYEGTGLYGESTLRRVDLETGEVLQGSPSLETVSTSSPGRTASVSSSTASRSSSRKPSPMTPKAGG